MLENGDCRNCQALCCGAGQSFTLTDEEYTFFRTQNSSLNQKGIRDSHKRFTFDNHKGRSGIANLYNLPKNCGFLIEKNRWLQCSIHDDPRRPEECGWFQAGGDGCRSIREAGSMARSNEIWNRLHPQHGEMYNIFIIHKRVLVRALSNLFGNRQ